MPIPGHTSVWQRVGRAGLMILLSMGCLLEAAMTSLISTAQLFALQKKSKPYSLCDYEPMKLDWSSANFREQSFKPRSKPLSPEKGNEYAGKEDWDKEKKASDHSLFDVKTIIAATLSSKGTFAAVTRGTAGACKIILRKAGGNFDVRAINKFVSTKFVSFWGENTISLDARGSVYYLDTTNRVFTQSEPLYYIPSALVVHDAGKYALVSVSSQERGQLLYFFQSAMGSAGESIMKYWDIGGYMGYSSKPSVISLATHPTENAFAVATEDGGIQLWNIVSMVAEDRRKIDCCTPHEKRRTAASNALIVMLQQDNYIAGASACNNLIWWDTRASQSSHYVVDGHSDTISSFKYVKDTLYVTGSEDGTVKLWDVRRLSRPSSTMTHGAPVAAVVRTEKGGVAACSKNSVVKYWDDKGKSMSSIEF